VEALQVLPGLRLHLRFRDGTEGAADLAALVTAADAGLFAALSDEAEFAGVRLELGVPTWPNGADLDPTWLYDAIRTSGKWTGQFEASD
jgi:hypothetical protein